MSRSHRALAVTALVLGLAATPPPVRAEMPALSRELVTEDFRRTDSAIDELFARRHVAFGFGVGEFLRGEGGGTWNPANQTGSVWGARLEGVARYGRLMVGADATNDGRLDADADSYAQRLVAGVHVPEAFVSLTGSLGLEQWDYAGTDVSAEFAPLHVPLGLRTLDVAPRVWTWLRWRHPEEGEDVFTPVAALAIQHVPALGSQLSLALSAREDLRHGAPPVTSGMLQIGYASVPAPLFGGGGNPDLPPPPGAQPPSSVDRSFFVCAGYAFPLDARSTARLAVQFGMRFVRPLGGE